MLHIQSNFSLLVSIPDFADVTLACEDDNFSALTVIQFLFLKMNNHNFIQASLAEFVSVWSAGGNASLNLTTTEGRVNMAFNVSLGHPGSAFSTLPSSVRRPRHRGPAEKEKSRQRVAANHCSAAAHQDVLESQHDADLTVSQQTPSYQDTLESRDVPIHQSAAHQDVLESQRVAAHQAAVVNAVRATSTAPVITSTFASVTARPGPVFKCDRCSSSFKNESGLKMHIGTAHKASLPNPATAMRLYKTMYYSPKDPSPFNAPPPPDCKSCNKATSWKASRTKSNKFWLHEYSCSACTDQPPTSTHTTIATQPLS